MLTLSTYVQVRRQRADSVVDNDEKGDKQN